MIPGEQARVKLLGLLALVAVFAFAPDIRTGPTMVHALLWASMVCAALSALSAAIAAFRGGPARHEAVRLRFLLAMVFLGLASVVAKLGNVPGEDGFYEIVLLAVIGFISFPRIAEASSSS